MSSWDFDFKFFLQNYAQVLTMSHSEDSEVMSLQFHVLKYFRGSWERRYGRRDCVGHVTCYKNWPIDISIPVTCLQIVACCQCSFLSYCTAKLFVYYLSIKWELKTKPMYECRCDERLKTKSEESTCLTYTGFLVELEHLKIKTTLIDEMFASVMGEYVFLKWWETHPN